MGRITQRNSVVARQVKDPGLAVAWGAAVAWVPSLALKLPHAMSVDKKKKKKKKIF